MHPRFNKFSVCLFLSFFLSFFIIKKLQRVEKTRLYNGRYKNSWRRKRRDSELHITEGTKADRAENSPVHYFCMSSVL
jgi:hypothetical protein